MTMKRTGEHFYSPDSFDNVSGNIIADYWIVQEDEMSGLKADHR